ncbi:hypothetical protein [Cytobacillus praedii]|uniref:Uncharacterized protein n=1 Tax=Cytobacillus praedii TaxID=1742358 RepID=A0A4R1ARF2_9BACI|nr:hypothetical protein [Cytobacillus praedii]TCI99998.1 hypothetical protein E0Y62_27020 [Cytobacillus praedii]
MEKPSKFHRHTYVGKGTEGADEYGYKYTWNSAHPDLEPTQMFYPDKYQNHPYCFYCGEKPYPIQAGLRDSNIPYNKRDYSVTGYMCTCVGAAAEISYRQDLIKLKELHAQDISELRKSYVEKLNPNLEKQFEIKMKYQRKELESELKNGRNYFSFSDIEMIKI